MHRAIAALILGFGASSLPASEPLSVAIVTDAAVSLPPRASAEFRSEVERVLSMPEIRIVWRDLSGVSGEESFHRIVVVRFQGNCRAGGAADSGRQGEALGYTHRSDGRVLPFVAVDCGRVAAVLARHNILQYSLTAAEALGRALARVAAHELYHALTESAEHAGEGLAQPALSARELFERGFGFAASTRAKILASLAAHDPFREAAPAQTATVSLRESGLH